MRYLKDRRMLDHLAPVTLRTIRHHLLDFSASHSNRTVGQLGPAAVDRWLASMGHLAPGTRGSRLSSLRVFARWCVRSGVVDKDWTTSTPRVRRPRRVPRDMTGEHVAAMLAECRDHRERAVVWLMFGAGLRCIEVSRLDVEDFDPATNTLHIVGKASHERAVPVAAPVRGAIVAYLAESGHGHGPLIRRLDNRERLGSARISGIAGRLVKDAGLKVRRYDGRSAHGLRAAAASDLYDVSLDPLVVQEFLGHASLATVSIYMRRASLERVRSAVTKRWEPLTPGVPCEP